MTIENTEQAVADILDRAADLLEPEGSWTVGHAARYPDGCPAAADDADAVCWCAWGAIYRVTGGSYTKPFEALRTSLGFDDGIDPATFGEAWNDAPERTQAEVVAALRSAASLARKGAENV